MNSGVVSLELLGEVSDLIRSDIAAIVTSDLGEASFIFAVQR